MAVLPATAHGAVAPIVLLALLGVVECKLHTGSVTLGGAQGEQWHFLGKFGYAIGTGHYEMRLRLNQPLDEDQDLPRPDLDVFLDEDWPSAMAQAPCRRALDAPARRSHGRLVPGQLGEWGRWQSGAVYQKVRPHIWYFALSDCRAEYAGGIVDSQRVSYTIDYEIRWKQFDTSELSLEMRYVPAASFFSLAALTVLGLRLAFRCRAIRRGFGQLHPVICVLGTAMALQWISQALHLLHLRVYTRDGVGARAVDALAEVLFVLSQVAGASLLLAIAQGYTLVRSKLSEVELLTPVVAVVAVLHVSLVAVGKLQQESSCTYHDNEGVIGWILVSIRISMLAWFQSGVKTLRASSGARLNQFLNSFEPAASTYFLAFPLIFTFIQVLAPYLQYPVLQIGLLAVQTTSWLWLAELFLSRGSYYEASELSASLLPGGAGAHCYSRSWRKKDM